jgi:replicative DNA helicase
MNTTTQTRKKEIRLTAPESTTEEAMIRKQPYNLLAEQAVLGAILTNNETLHKIADFLESNHFYEPVHQRIYRTIQTFMERGLAATPISLKNVFDKDEALQDLDGAGYLARLVGMVTSVINIHSYARTIYDLALRRELISLGEDVVNNAFEDDPDLTADKQVEEAEQRLFNLASTGTMDKGFQALKMSLTEALARAELAYKRDEAISGIPTRLDDFDHLLGGFQNSDLLILAGRPSMGKTALAINFAMNACKALLEEYKKDPAIPGSVPPGVGFFSLEMSSEQLAGRMLAMETGINASKLRIGNFTEEEFALLVKGNKSLYDMPFFIDDTPALSISALRTRARRLKRQHNLALLVVDYLQLVRGTSKSSEGNRVQEVSEITQGLKAIAKELDIPVIALSQLSRAVESREDKRPQLSDLRESGSIEQDADIVMFIYREEYYLSRTQPPEEDQAKHSDWQEKMNRVMNRADVIIAKQRHGPIGTVTLHFDANTTRFSNDAEERHGQYYAPRD